MFSPMGVPAFTASVTAFTTPYTVTQNTSGMSTRGRLCVKILCGVCGYLGESMNAPLIMMKTPTPNRERLFMKLSAIKSSELTGVSYQMDVTVCWNTTANAATIRSHSA